MWGLLEELDFNFHIAKHFLEPLTKNLIAPNLHLNHSKHIHTQYELKNEGMAEGVALGDPAGWPATHLGGFRPPWTK